MPNSAPAIVGNVSVWKPSPAATYANYVVFKAFEEAGVPAGVIQFVPGPPVEVCAQVIAHPSFAALHFTGSTFVFKQLWKNIAANIDTYKSYPRLVGETGGKNFHLIHKSAEVKNAVMQTVRGAFEYQGQKCSALSRVYIASSLWSGGFKEQLLTEVAKLKVGPPQDFTNFIGPVMYVSPLSRCGSVIDKMRSGRPAFDKITSYIQKAKDAGGEILIGGSGMNFIKPTPICRI